MRNGERRRDIAKVSKCNIDSLICGCLCRDWVMPGCSPGLCGISSQEEGRMQKMEGSKSVRGKFCSRSR